MPLISIQEAAKAHNAVFDVTPFEQLPPKRQDQVYRFYLNGGVTEASGPIRWAGKKLNGLRSLMEFMSEAPIPRTATEVSDIDQLAIKLQPQIVAGDQQAWAQVYRAFLPYAKAIATNELYYFPGDVDEVAADAMKTLHDKISQGQWDEGTKLMTWLKYIVKHKAMNLVDKEKKHLKDVGAVDDTPHEEDEEGDVRHSTAVATDLTANPADQAMAADDKDTFYDKNFVHKQLRKMLDDLPKPEKQALAAYAFENKSYQQIADEFGWPLHKVKSRIENARWYTKEWLARNPEMKAIMNFVLSESNGVQEDPVAFLRRKFRGLPESAEAIAATLEHCELSKNMQEAHPGQMVKIVSGEFKGKTGEVKRDFPEAHYMHVLVNGRVVIVGHEEIARDKKFYVEAIRRHIADVEAV